MKDMLSLLNRSKKKDTDLGANPDSIIKIDIDKDIILALDDNGNELCKFAIEVDGAQLVFNSPKLNNWNPFVRAMAELCSALGQYTDKLEMPDNKVENFKNSASYELFNRIIGKIFLQNYSVAGKCMRIFFKLLNGRVENIKRRFWQSEWQAQKQWFKANVQIIHLQKLFGACLAVDDLVKKNATFVLTSQFQKQQAENGGLSLAKRQESQSPESTASQSYTFAPL